MRLHAVQAGSGHHKGTQHLPVQQQHSPCAPHLPADMDCLPTQMVPFMKVPVVSTAALQRKVMPK
jgi:hypothetical protein